MLSGTPSNKSAYASSDERECRIVRGSDRIAESALAPNCFAQITQETHERPLLTPRPSAQSCSNTEPTSVNPVVTSKLDMFVGVAKKPQHLTGDLAGRTPPSCQSWCAKGKQPGQILVTPSERTRNRSASQQPVNRSPLLAAKP
jgi:hypothetical protein